MRPNEEMCPSRVALLVLVALAAASQQVARAAVDPKLSIEFFELQVLTDVYIPEEVIHYVWLIRSEQDRGLFSRLVELSDSPDFDWPLVRQLLDDNFDNWRKICRVYLKKISDKYTATGESGWNFNLDQYYDRPADKMNYLNEVQRHIDFDLMIGHARFCGRLLFSNIDGLGQEMSPTVRDPKFCIAFFKAKVLKDISTPQEVKGFATKIGDEIDEPIFERNVIEYLDQSNLNWALFAKQFDENYMRSKEACRRYLDEIVASYTSTGDLGSKCNLNQYYETAKDKRNYLNEARKHKEFDSKIGFALLCARLLGEKIDCLGRSPGSIQFDHHGESSS